jgi:predicted O-methyltransferase YrrM
MNDINFEFFGLKSPFDRFDASIIEKNREIENWQYPDSIDTFKQLILEKRPKLIIELGSYLGWSAITMAKICKENNINCKILCIDTWLGSVEHWRKDKCNTLHKYNFFKDGTSTMFDEFCRNVISHELQDYIISLPNTTDMMYKYLIHHNIKSDLIYVDASHEYDSVLNDLTSYFNLLNEDGYIFGDDVCWLDVNNAAIQFSKNIGKTIQYSKYKNLYYIKK